MRILFVFFAFVSLLLSSFTWKTEPVRNVAIGSYSYDIALVKQFDHDDDSYNTYFVVTRAKTWVKMCSSTLLTTRADTVLTKGAYLITSKSLQFKERYWEPRKVRGFVFADSVRKTFCPDKTGNLRLTEMVEYKAGKATTKRW